MRAFIAALSLLLASSPGLAAKKKVVPQPRPQACFGAQSVATQPVGYRRVEVALEVPVPDDQDPQEAAKRSAFAFGLHISAASTRFVTDEWIIAVGVCTRDFVTSDGRFFPAKTVWIKVRSIVDEIKDHGYTLKAYVWLPSSIVTQQPRAETELNTGIGYRGEWVLGEETTLFLLPNK